MAIQIDKNLPALVGTRNDTWLKIQLSVGTILQVKVFHQAFLITTQKMSVDSMGIIAFNLKRILQSIGTFPNIIDAELPTFNLNIVTACSKNFKDFSVELTEIQADGTVVMATTINSTALLAGLTPELAFTTQLLTYLSGPPWRFLTNKPSVQLSGKDTQMYLYYFNSNIDQPNAAIEYRYQMFFTDGTFTSERIFSTQAIRLSMLPAGYTQMNLEPQIPDGKTLDRWEVWIVDGDEASERFTYELDEQCHPEGRDLLFLSSLGGFDTLRLPLVEEVNLDRQGDVVERYVSADTTLMDGQYYETEILTTRKFKASTGLLPVEDRYWLQELFASPKIFEINNGQFLPIRILSNSALLKNRADYLPVSFEYRYRFDDIGYTKQ